jgi:hypothetical protein
MALDAIRAQAQSANPTVRKFIISAYVAAVGT